MSQHDQQPYPAQHPGFGSGEPVVHGGPIVDLVVPPGAELASRGRRVGAFFLAIPLAVVTLGIGYVIWGLVVWGRGTTPALQVLGCRCVRRVDGSTATWGTMALRNVVGRFLLQSVIPLGGLVGFIIFLANQRRQSLHDLVAGTIVVKDLS